MGRRFGRNQKRAMREALKQAESVAEERGEALRMTEYRLRRAMDGGEGEAFRRFMADARRYEDVCARLAEAVGSSVGDELRPYSEKLLRAARNHRPNARLDAWSALEDMATTISIEFPSVRMNYRIIS